MLQDACATLADRQFGLPGWFQPRDILKRIKKSSPSPRAAATVARGQFEVILIMCLEHI